MLSGRSSGSASEGTGRRLRGVCAGDRVQGRNNGAMTDAPLVADAPAGRFRGSLEDGVRVWRGIRYAQPPTGDARWRAPQPAPPLPDIVDALAFGPVCPQPINPAVPLPHDAVFDEDCLSLNVWAPADATNAPVMVWLHGGAYTFGSSSQSIYDGAALAASGVVIVTVNYRVGALGFLDLTSFGEPGEFDSNLALRDALLALHWVQTNITAFGGDPARVTLFGESAGGGLVTTLLAVPSAAGLFHRAIAQSSPASSVYGVARAAEAAKQFLLDSGVSTADPEELRRIPAEELATRSARLFAEVPQQAPGTIAFAPVIDGELLPEAPVTVLREGRGLPVPLIIGTNKDEASVFKFMKSPLLPISDERIREMLADIARERPEAQPPEMAQIRLAYEGVRRQAIGTGIARDIGFRLPSLWIAEGHSEVAPVWLYRFDQATPMLKLIGLGATHASELAYVWRRLDDASMEFSFRLGGRTRAARVSARMSARWLAFARGETPDAAAAATPDRAPDWPRFDAAERSTLIIDTVDRVESDPDAKLRAGWGDEILAFP